MRLTFDSPVLFTAIKKEKKSKKKKEKKYSSSSASSSSSESEEEKERKRKKKKHKKSSESSKSLKRSEKSSRHERKRHRVDDDHSDKKKSKHKSHKYSWWWLNCYKLNSAGSNGWFKINGCQAGGVTVPKIFKEKRFCSHLLIRRAIGHIFKGIRCFKLTT